MYSGGGSSMKWMAESTAVQRMRLVAEGKRRGHSNVRLRCLKVKIDSLEAINLHSLRVQSSSPCSSPHLPATLMVGNRQTPRENGKTRVEIPKSYMDDRRPISALETWFLTGPGILPIAVLPGS